MYILTTPPNDVEQEAADIEEVKVRLPKSYHRLGDRVHVVIVRMYV